MPPPGARPYQPADRPDVLALGVDARTIDAGNHRLYVSEAAGRPVAVVVAIHPDGDVAELGGVLPALSGSLGRFHDLLTAAVAGAIAEGYSEGEATVRDRTLVTVLEARYGRTAEPSAYSGPPRRPVEWTFIVDLQDLLDQLQPGP